MRTLQRMCRELIGALFGVFAGALLLCTSSTSASASVMYNWLCDDPTCNGDTSFTSTLSLLAIAHLRLVPSQESPATFSFGIQHRGLATVSLWV